jgi:hypothetical protein
MIPGASGSFTMTVGLQSGSKLAPRRGQGCHRKATAPGGFDWAATCVNYLTQTGLLLPDKHLVGELDVEGIRCGDQSLLQWRL